MQKELLRLQHVKRRTVVFISHDLDEAVRIGDRIAIMKDGQIQQLGTPDEILRHPANDYVKSFIRGVDAALVFKAGDLAHKKRMTFISEQSDRRGCHAALHLLEREGRDWAFVTDSKARFLGIVTPASLTAALEGQRGSVDIARAFLPDIAPLLASTPITEIFEPIVSVPCPLPVVDAHGIFIGAISRNTLLRFLDRTAPTLVAPKQIQPIVLEAQTDATTRD